MSYVDTNPLKNSTIMLIYAEKNEVLIDPPYQRMGGVWTTEKKQLLIDSILNDYDIPKLYFHLYSREVREGSKYSYAVIDGRQRLEAIWDFIEGKFTLSSDFVYQKNPDIKLSGLSYDDISKEYPRVKVKFDSFVLPIISVETDDEELIDDMFSRLNEAVPLNAAEKRNAIGGDLVCAIREISRHRFFTEKVKFSNRRYQYHEVVCRFLLVENSIREHNRLYDTKKEYLDSLARKFRSNRSSEVEELKRSCLGVLDMMSTVFTEKDELLRSQGNMAIYYLLFKYAAVYNELSNITRRVLIDFIEKLKQNRYLAESDFENSSFELLEYDRLAQQGTNDSTNIRERYSILARTLNLTVHAIQ